MSKHETVSQELRIEIAAGAFAASGKLPSKAQLVERFGLPAYHRAGARDLQLEGLIDRRAGSGTFVRGDSTTNIQARVLGLPVPERGATEIFEAICGEFENDAAITPAQSTMVKIMFAFDLLVSPYEIDQMTKSTGNPIADAILIMPTEAPEQDQ